MKVHLLFLFLLLSITAYAQRDSAHRKLFAINPNEIYDISDNEIDSDGTSIIRYSGRTRMPNVTISVSGKYIIGADKKPIGKYKVSKHRVKDITYTTISYYTVQGKLIAKAVITPSNPKTVALTNGKRTIAFSLQNGTGTEDVEHIAKRLLFTHP
ncbi:MAG TPA: hypothetical protein VN721_11010 [Flavipsychrobacter sp.]|nr:hypothetical protein [Flavipsychrobacter sp.]